MALDAMKQASVPITANAAATTSAQKMRRSQTRVIRSIARLLAAATIA